MIAFLCRALNLGLCSILGYQNHCSAFSAEYQIWYSNNILFLLVAQSHHQKNRIFRLRTKAPNAGSHRVAFGNFGLSFSFSGEKDQTKASPMLPLCGRRDAR